MEAKTLLDKSPFSFSPAPYCEAKRAPRTVGWKEHCHGFGSVAYDGCCKNIQVFFCALYALTSTFVEQSFKLVFF
jgi:hypothetical protein